MLRNIKQKMPPEKPPGSTARAEWHRTAVECRATAAAGLHLFITVKSQTTGTVFRVTRSSVFSHTSFSLTSAVFSTITWLLWFWDTTIWSCVGWPSGHSSHSLLFVLLLPYPSLVSSLLWGTHQVLSVEPTITLIALSPAWASELFILWYII